MPDPLLVTKVSLRRLRQILVPRKKVLSQLGKGVQDGHLLTWASAPAGYEKTTALQQVGHPPGLAAPEIAELQVTENTNAFHN